MSASSSSLRGLACGFCLLGLGMGLSTMALAQGPRDAGAPDAAARRDVGYSADPPPLRTASQWVMTLRYAAGRVEFVSARAVQLRRPTATPRRVGRWALELLSGPTVVDRVRFDFPLLGADELAGQRRPYNDPPRFERKAVVTHRILVPDSPRVSRARLVDRATGAVMALPWPPVVAAVDAGADARADAPVEARAADVIVEAAVDGGVSDAGRGDARADQ